MEESIRSSEYSIPWDSTYAIRAGGNTAGAVTTMSAPNRPLASTSIERRTSALKEPIATRAAIPKTTEREKSISRPREARESLHAILRTNLMAWTCPRQGSPREGE